MRFFAILFFLLSCVAVPVQADDFEGDFWDAEDGTPANDSQSLEMITQRMKSLSSSLNGMPQPPAFQEKINLPAEVFAEKRKER